MAKSATVRIGLKSRRHLQLEARSKRVEPRSWPKQLSTSSAEKAVTVKAAARAGKGKGKGGKGGKGGGKGKGGKAWEPWPKQDREPCIICGSPWHGKVCWHDPKVALADLPNHVKRLHGEELAQLKAANLAKIVKNA